jgi:hypothetical protein
MEVFLLVGGKKTLQVEKGSISNEIAAIFRRLANGGAAAFNCGGVDR